MGRNTGIYGSGEYNDRKVIDAMKERLYSVVLDDSKDGKKSVELTRFDLDENYHRLIRHIIDYLKDNEYEVDSSTDMENLKRWDRKEYFEISFRSRRKTGLFRNKIEYGNTHTLWMGYTGDRSILREVGFKIDGRSYTPNPALQEVYTIVRNRK